MQKYDRKSILKWQTYSFALYAIQYFLLGAYSGMLTYIINMTRRFDNIPIANAILSILWIIYDIIIYSYIASVTEMIIILSVMKSLNSNPKLLCEKT